MQGLMQHGALTVDKILDHAAQWHGHREIVSRSVEGPIVRTTYSALRDRAKRVSNALLSLGVKPGDRVATLAWNTGRHMEAWYGIMGIGAVCHTLNPRLFPEQIAWIADHAGDRVLFTDLTFLPIVAAILPRVPSIEHVGVFTDGANMPAFAPASEAPNFKGVHCYESLVDGQTADCAWGGFDEGTAAGLCYTSGTTGDPKGVLYSHRSNVLHTFITLQPDVMGMSQRDVILPVVPMFHANAWGITFSAPATGAKIVMPGAKMDGASIYELLDSEGVTFSAAVPTVWQMLLQHLRETGAKLPVLRKVVIGGAACPEHIIRAFQEDYDVEVVHAWGMTETSPVGTLSVMTDELARLPYEQQMPWRLKQGRPPMGVELKITDDGGARLPHDGKSFGNLKIKGPTIAGEYFRGAGGKILDDEGFFDTGDVATIDHHGFMQITDRAKDVVKSGGEWISTIEIENIAAGHPKAALAAVIGVPHPKWDERPLLVKLKPGETSSREEFLEYLQGKIAKWWMPDDVLFVDDIPLGATGKIDKKLIRQGLKDYVLPGAVAAGAAAAATLAAADGSQSARIYAPEPAETPPDLVSEVPGEDSASGEPEAGTVESATVPALIAPEGDAESAVVAIATPETAEASGFDTVAKADDDEAEAEADADAAGDVEPAPMAFDPADVATLESALSEPPRPVVPAVEIDGDPPLRLHAPADFPFAPLDVEAEPGALDPTPEVAFMAAPGGLAAADLPFAMPVVPRRPARAKAGPGWAGLYLDFALIVAIAPALLVAAGAVGVKFGWIGTPLGFGAMTQDWAPKVAFLGVATGVTGLIVALIAGFSTLWKRALLALVITVGTIAVMLAAQAVGGMAPPIHDVATDWKRPLTFSDAALAARGGSAQAVEDDPSLPVGSAAFAGRRVADVNAETCSAARPLVLERSPSDAYEAAKTALLSKGLTLTTDDPMDGRLEATGRSFWYGLIDDLVVRVRPDTAGARIDMRSIGRDPGPDLGRNCARIRSLMAVIAK